MSKVVFLGNSGVGKSSVLKRLKFDIFDPGTESTIGCEFFAKDIIINEQISRKLLLWDTAGQEVFRSFTQNFLRGAKIIVIMFDVSNRKSLEDLYGWIEEAKKQNNAKILIVGNKSDLESSVDYEQTIMDIKNKNFSLELFVYGVVSARNGTNINDLFLYIANMIDELPMTPPPAVNLDMSDNSYRKYYGGCC